MKASAICPTWRAPELLGRNAPKVMEKEYPQTVRMKPDNVRFAKSKTIPTLKNALLLPEKGNGRPKAAVLSF